MSYATISDVKSLFRNFQDNSDPAVTDASISKFLDNAKATIDSRLYGLYTLPITGPISLKILSQVEMFLVADIVDNILNTYSDAQKKPQYYKRAMEMLADIAPEKDAKTGKQPEPLTKLYDSTYLGTNVQKGKFKLSSAEGTIIKKGSDTW